jgi:hypothetical protein
MHACSDPILHLGTAGPVQYVNAANGFGLSRCGVLARDAALGHHQRSTGSTLDAAPCSATIGTLGGAAVTAAAPQRSP